jgi:NADH:ubiquinone oxidoreductase subunit C
MEKAQLIELVKSLCSDAEVTEGRQFVEAVVPVKDLHSVAEQLKTDPETAFDFLFCLSGVDYGKELGVVYHVRSTKLGHSIVLKIRFQDRDNPVADSVTDIWLTAEYHEREVYDLLGIKFRNHPDLRRFFLPASAGYPLRKDFVDDENIVVKK